MHRNCWLFSRLLSVVLACGFVHLAPGQTVGVVLSGGGATAMTHVGFLKALEEEGIPIDYIAGSSMGAIVGAFYAAGYSIDEMEEMVQSDEFIDMATGVLDEQLTFYFKEDEPDAGLATIKYGRGSFITQNLPTNLINPVLFDYKLMELLSAASAAADYDFDRLFVPFRCVAADVEDKRLVLFDQGNLNIAVRASATYPFYLKPIKIDNRLLYDGGLYNNFPSEFLYSEFLPDVILGCNVSDVLTSPDEDDVFSQLESMIRSKSNFEPLCEQMVIVEPETDVGTFDFGRSATAISDGYVATRTRMGEVRELIQRRVRPEEVAAHRAMFRSALPDLVFDEIRLSGLERNQNQYVRRIINPREDSITIEDLKPIYFRLFADDRVRSIFPVAVHDSTRGAYTLNLDVRRERDLFLSFGGNFSSRPINTGYIGLRYNIFGKVSTTLAANSYFGKYYGSVNGRAKFDISGRLPFSIEPGFTFNTWDYFSSFATFFELVRPSFIVLNERFGSLKVRFPLGNAARLVIEGDYGELDDDYYQMAEFSPVDTADRTVFELGVAEMRLEHSTLNRKQWASEGSSWTVKAKYVAGEERSIPGSTSALRDTTYLGHDWFSLRASYRKYFDVTRRFKTGFLLEGLASTQDLFQNFTATIVSAPVFRPIPESWTFYLPQFHAHNYAAAGAVGIWSFGSVDLRGEAYAFNAFGRFVSNEVNQARYDWTPDPLWILSGSAVLHTPIGPASLSVNYYDHKQSPFSFNFNFGYLIFNDSVRD